MTYSSGSTILEGDYNNFATDVNTIWGTGSVGDGYGQTNTIAAVSQGATITATQWATLLTRISSAATHQGTSITTITNPTAGNTIEAYAALSANITAIQSGKNNASASGSDTSAATTTTSTWTSSATTSKTITFPSADQLRYFFNAGGMIRMSFSRSGGTTSDQNTSWTNLLSNTGTIVLTGQGSPGENKTIASTAYTGTTKIGGAGTPTILLTGTGAYSLTGSAVAIFKQIGTTYNYTTNFINIDASISGNVITFAVTLSDLATPGVDSIDGTLTMTTVIRDPSSGTLADTWGTPTQNSASWSLS